MKQTNTKISDYILSLPEQSRDDIETLHKLIVQNIPSKVKPVMWEGIFWGGSQQRIIGYGEWSYIRKKETLTWFVVGLALQKNYFSVFINSVEGVEYIAEKYKDKLGKAKVGKSSVSFKSIEDINVEALMELIKKAFKS